MTQIQISDFWARIGFSLRAPSNEYLGSVFAYGNLEVNFCDSYVLPS